MLNEQQIKALVSELESFYGAIVMNGGILESLWIQKLQDLSLQQVEDAIAICFTKNPKQYGFFPSPQQILDYAQGEYPPPGEYKSYEETMAYINQRALPYEEPTPEQIQELAYRGRLMGRIISYGGRFMTHDEKDAFITSLKHKQTHELEHMAKNAEEGHRIAKDPNRSVEDLKGTYAKLREELEKRVSSL